MDWLREHAQSDNVVFSSYFTGSRLPHPAGTLAYIGQTYQTTHFDEKFALGENIFRQQDDRCRTCAISNGQSNPIRILWARGTELGEFDPAQARYLFSVFWNGEASIYQVLTR